MLIREEWNDMENGNSRNGYHKVKCQVPETEELQEKEGGRGKWTADSTKGVIVTQGLVLLKSLDQS